MFYLQGAKAIADLLKKSSTLRVVELNNNMIDYSVCSYLNMFFNLVFISEAALFTMFFIFYFPFGMQVGIYKSCWSTS